MIHCCKNMNHYVFENREIGYNMQYRRYTLRLSESENGTHQLLWYCPWCGSKLPKSLSNEWFVVLKSEYGLSDPIFDDADKVPDEFKTDEWWRKRGL